MPAPATGAMPAPATGAMLVTGGAGFIGSNFARYWAGAHPSGKVVVYDSLSYAGDLRSLDGLGPSVTFVKGDITDQEDVESVLQEHDVSVVVNFAAESHNSLAVVDPGRFFWTNVLGTQRLLDACRRVWVERLHHISTCEVYGDLDLDAPDSAAFTESSPYLPRTPYNASKAAADHAVRAYFTTYGLPVTITNCANNYGPYQFPEKLVPLFTTLALDDQPLPVYASKHNRREWVHVLDHCRAIEAVLERGRLGETYLVGTGFEASVEEVADRILDLLGKPASLKTVVPDRPSHDRRYLLDSSKITSELSWRPEISFDDGMSQTVAWYAANRHWWEPLRKRAPVAEGSWGSAGGVL
ncbi:MAG: dTDP-glucose 4,6-dehydratase [Acidimicrobiales bacterium]